jgi:hypothetical protein
MQKPINIGNKTIDAANVHLIRELTPERLATLPNWDKDWTVEIRALGSEGGFVEKLPLADVVAAFSKIGETLTVLPSGEAVRTGWAKSVKDFSSREGQPNKFGSVVTFKHPETGATAEEWLVAKRHDIVPNAPSLASLASGPGSSGG